MGESEKKAKDYWRRKNLLRFAHIALSFFFLAVVQLTPASSFFKKIAVSFSGDFYVSLGVYLVLLNLLFYIVFFPLNIYEGFLLERGFALSNLTLSGWLKDEVKKGLLSFSVFFVLIGTLYATLRNLPQGWWIAASLLWITLSVILAKIFPVIVIPVFYKCGRLNDDKLRGTILRLAADMRVKVLDVFEIGLSKKTKKSNAAIVGWGNTKRIVLGDNLINEFTPEEVEVVVAHEMAHYKLAHIWKLVCISSMTIIGFFFLLSRAGPKIASGLGAAGPSDIGMFPAIWLLFNAYELILMPARNWISRRMEANADILAIRTTRLKDAFVSLMARLAEKNLADKDPHPLIEFLFYDHPPIAKRIALAKGLRLDG